MKSSIKKMSALLTMMAAAILAFTFTGCSDDDEPMAEVTYTYGFSKMSASHPDFLEEMNKIEKGFQSALGITGKHFTKKGSIDECDKQVYEACQKAFDSLKGEAWQGDYTFQVTNVGTGNIVYTATFSANNENRPPIGNKAMEDVDMGDFYFIDGSFADKSTELTSTQKSVCIGVVLKKGRDNSGDWADNCNYTLKDGTTLMPEVHGYVLALRDVKGIIVWSQPWSNIEVGCDRNPTTGFNGYSNTRAIINAIEEHGWTLQREFPAAYYAVNYENVCPAPAKTSGWFLPSGGQCQYWLNNKDVIHNSMLNAEGDGCFGLYWSSSEDADNPVSNAYYLDSCPGYDKIYSEWKISSNAVRACLAF